MLNESNIIYPTMNAKLQSIHKSSVESKERKNKCIYIYMFYVLYSMFYHIYLCVYMNRFSIKKYFMRYIFSALPTPLLLSVFINTTKKGEDEMKNLWSLIFKFSHFHTFGINTNQYQISIFFMTVLWDQCYFRGRSRGRKICVSGVIKTHVLLQGKGRWVLYWMSLNPWVNEWGLGGGVVDRFHSLFHPINVNVNLANNAHEIW